MREPLTEPRPLRRPRSGELVAGGSCCASLQTSREHRGRGPERNEQGRRGGRLAPPQLRRTPPPRAQAEGILRQRPPHGGDWEGGAVIKYLPLSQRERWRLCEAWTNRRRQASGRPGQTDGDRHLADSLPPTSPLGGISLEDKSVLIAPCMPGSLPGLRYACTTPHPIPRLHGA